MKREKYIKYLVLIVIIGLFFNLKNIYAEGYVDQFDSLFASNQYILYTEEEINDTASLTTAVNNLMQYYYVQESWSSPNDYSTLNINLNSCNYVDTDHMTCNFSLKRNNTAGGDYSSTTVKDYENIEIIIESNIDQYFSFVTNNNVIIDYPEEMFNNNENEKNSYIMQYFNSLYVSNNNSSTSYGYDSNYSSLNIKMITRTDRTGQMITRVIKKQIDDVVFQFEEGDYSDDFEELAPNRTITIKSDTTITSELLNIYLSSHRPHGITSTISYNVDGNISNNKVIIKKDEYISSIGNTTLERHVVNLATANIDLDKFTAVGMGTTINIPADEPENNLQQYIGNYFNMGQTSNETPDGGSETFSVRVDYMDPTNVVVTYMKYDNNGYIEDTQFHQAQVQFTGYSNTVSDTYNNNIGLEVTINADVLNMDTINRHFSGAQRALMCNNSYTQCDIALYDPHTGTTEIHQVTLVLNNAISEQFINAFNINNNAIDITMGEDVVIMYNSFSQSYYDETTSNLYAYDCRNFNGTMDKKCTLTLRNDRNNTTEMHDIEYNVVNANPSDYFESQVNTSIDVYPGETTDVWNRISYANNLFSKNNDYNIRSMICNSSTSKCPVAIRNNSNNIEIQNSTINLHEGTSPEFSEYIPGDTINLNAINKNDPDFLYRASEGYLMSKTKTWSYITDYDNGQAQVVYNNLETHTMNLNFAENNAEHKAIVDALAEDIGNTHLRIKTDDLEFINNFYYNEDMNNPVTSNYNSRIVNEQLNNIINNKHISYFLAVEGGLGSTFMSMFGGKVVLYYDGVAYATTYSYFDTVFNYILYIPDDTQNTPEAFIEAAQKRIDDYLGANSGIEVTYSRVLNNNEIDPNYTDITGSDGNVYRLTYKNRTTEFIIVKNSSKMLTSTFLASDVNNNINISSDNANYPTNTVVSSDILDKNSNAYKNLINRLGLTNALIIDINLYSPTLGDINNFNGVEFDVNVPLDESLLTGNQLYAYYIDEDGRVESHPITLDDIFASFNTNHFSTYIISEEASVSNKVNTDDNPATGDNIIKYILLSCLSIIGLAISILYLNKKKLLVK